MLPRGATTSQGARAGGVYGAGDGSVTSPLYLRLEAGEGLIPLAGDVVEPLAGFPCLLPVGASWAPGFPTTMRHGPLVSSDWSTDEREPHRPGG